MAGKLRLMLCLALLAVGVAGCTADYGYLDGRGIYGPGGGVGRD